MYSSLKRKVVSLSEKTIGKNRTNALKVLIKGDTHIHSRITKPQKDNILDIGENNSIIGNPKLDNSKIIFRGNNNILFCEDGVSVTNGVIEFAGSNSVIYLGWGKQSRYCSMNMTTFSDSASYIGKNTNLHKGKRHKTAILVHENKNLIIGEDCLFSLNIWFRTSDAHPIYSSSSKKRLNTPKSILIGDHVWIGQDVTILKGSAVGSGSIIAAGSIVSGKELLSNCSYAGVPARKVSEDIFFTKTVANKLTTTESKQLETFESDEYIYTYKIGEQIKLKEIDKNLMRLKNSNDKLNYIIKHLAIRKSKNRFYIGNS